MKTKNLISIVLTVAIASAAIIGVTYALRNNTKTISPENTVDLFYSNWINHEGNPLIDKIYQSSPYVSKEFADKVDRVIASFDKESYDPILCAQDIPTDIDIVNTAKKENSSTVTLKEVFGSRDKIIEVMLIKEKNEWKINDIVCGEGQRESEEINNASPVIQDLISKHIRENISDLSPEKAVLGGTFYVTSIIFTGPYTCVVDYEDGHIALRAQVEFNVPKSEEVEIKSFKLIENENNVFKKTGNLTKSGDALYLVYEEPGKPGLSIKLEFNENSFCADKYIDNSCYPEYWQIGDRVEISGKKENDTLLVINFRIIGESSENIKNDLLITTFDECLALGNEILYPDCIDCKPYCETDEGLKFEQPDKDDPTPICQDLCGNGLCEEIVCLGEGCPCAETTNTCPADCK